MCPEAANASIVGKEHAPIYLTPGNPSGFMCFILEEEEENMVSSIKGVGRGLVCFD